MAGWVEAIAPSRFGARFRWLLGAFWLDNVCDGVNVAAGPLLVASLTRNAFLIALGAAMNWLPPLLFGLWAGVVSDRANRKRIVYVVYLVRAAILATLTVTILTGSASIALVLGVLFLLSAADVFGTNATNTLLPMIVSREDLAIANARMQAGFVTVNQLIGPPIGAALFAAGRAWPFGGQVVVLLAAALLVGRMVLPEHSREQVDRRPVLHDIAEGLAWVRRHAPVRTLVLTIFIFNITFGAAWSVLVIYARHHLGLGAVGFGLITTVGAVGGLLGTLSYGWITRRVSLGNIMRVGLIIEMLTHLGLASTSLPAVALPIFFVFGAHASIWGTTSVTVRQRAVPLQLQGRVGSVNTVGVFGGLVIGSGIGGLLAQHVGVTAPFWFAFAGSAVFLVLLWPQLSNIAHDDAAATVG